MPDLAFTVYEIDKTFEKLDLDESGKITYQLFLIATLESGMLNDPELIKRLFNELDST